MSRAVRAAMLGLALVPVALGGCASDQDPDLTPAPAGGPSTTSQTLSPCPPGGPDATTPAAGCLDGDGTVVRP